MSDELNRTTLEVKGLQGFYGQSHVLQGIDLELKSGEVVSLLGRNGVGKTSTLRAIAAIMPRVLGDIRLGELQLVGLPSFLIARRGVVYVPSGRRSFARLTVRDNLQVALYGRRRQRNSAQESDDEQLTAVLSLFPSLSQRLTARAGSLSGGENQMLKMACALLLAPKFLLLDEPTEGLAPVIVQELATHIQTLARRGVGILLAEQNYRFALSLSGRAYVLDKGTVKYQCQGSHLLEDQQLLAHLGI